MMDLVMVGLAQLNSFRISSLIFVKSDPRTIGVSLDRSNLVEAVAGSSER